MSIFSHDYSINRILTEEKCTDIPRIPSLDSYQMLQIGIVINR